MIRRLAAAHMLFCIHQTNWWNLQWLYYDDMLTINVNVVFSIIDMIHLHVSLQPAERGSPSIYG